MHIFLCSVNREIKVRIPNASHFTVNFPGESFEDSSSCGYLETFHFASFLNRGNTEKIEFTPQLRVKKSR